jgi:hypothetical protein
MRILLVSSALALSAVLFAVPVSAHHNSPFTEEIEGKVPDGALDTHNAAVEDVLERLEELGISGAMEGSTMSNDMDPADEAQGNTCAIWDEDCDAGPGNVDSPSEGMDRGPSTTYR